MAKYNTALTILATLQDNSNYKFNQKKIGELIEARYDYKPDRETIRRGIDDIIKVGFPIKYHEIDYSEVEKKAIITELWYDSGGEFFMSAIKRIAEGETIRIISPYNSDFIKAAKMIQGKWNADEKSWDFPKANEEQLDKILIDNYGESGKCEETVDVIINLNEASDIGGDGLYVNSLLIARRRSRDGDVILNKNAVLLSGGFPESAGSARYPRCNPEDGTKVRITVSREWYENSKDYECIEQVVKSGTIDKSKLIEEKERLLARIAEIDKLITE